MYIIKCIWRLCRVTTRERLMVNRVRFQQDVVTACVRSAQTRRKASQTHTHIITLTQLPQFTQSLLRVGDVRICAACARPSSICILQSHHPLSDRLVVPQRCEWYVRPKKSARMLFLKPQTHIQYVQTHTHIYPHHRHIPNNEMGIIRWPTHRDATSRRRRPQQWTLSHHKPVHINICIHTHTRTYTLLYTPSST